MSGDASEESKELVHRCMDALIDRDREAFAEVFADDFVVQPFGMEREAFIEAEFAYYDAFPDLTYTLDEMIAEGDRIAFRWSMRGTHSGEGGPEPFGQLEPTHEEIDVSGINIARVEDGKITEWWPEWGTLELFQQLGVVSLPIE